MCERCVVLVTTLLQGIPLENRERWARQRMPRTVLLLSMREFSSQRTTPPRHGRRKPRRWAPQAIL